jgi:hypothetical protein
MVCVFFLYINDGSCIKYFQLQAFLINFFFHIDFPRNKIKYKKNYTKPHNSNNRSLSNPIVQKFSCLKFVLLFHPPFAFFNICLLSLLSYKKNENSKRKRRGERFTFSWFMLKISLRYIQIETNK